MTNQPFLINEQSFQTAWVEALKLLRDNGWEGWNLVVHIADATAIDDTIHRQVCNFCDLNGFLGPKHVKYTIFPYKQYRGKGTANKLFRRYHRFYRWTRKRPHSTWGTYFYRMMHYRGSVNQLENIVNAILRRDKTYKAAYTIIIQEPGAETTRTEGGPCLNYIAVQCEPGDQMRLNLLSCYRNHDFLERAYGNYWGLCNLLIFLAEETGSKPGSLTCISSHAYVAKARTKLTDFLDNFS